MILMRPVSVILADDHAMFREALQVLLNREPDMAVTATVSNGEDAVSEALQLKPDVVILDIEMPGLSAFEAARKIKRELSDTHVVFLSAHHNDAYVEQAFAVNASGYLNKSQLAEEIIDAINKVMSGQRCYSPEVLKRLVIEERTGPRKKAKQCSRLSILTRRELEVLGYLAQGMSRKQIARLLHICEKTAELHSQNVMDKLDIHDRVALARFAIREGLVNP